MGQAVIYDAMKEEHTLFQEYAADQAASFLHPETAIYFPKAVKLAANINDTPEGEEGVTSEADDTEGEEAEEAEEGEFVQRCVT